MMVYDNRDTVLVRDDSLMSMYTMMIYDNVVANHQTDAYEESTKRK